MAVECLRVNPTTRAMLKDQSVPWLQSSVLDLFNGTAAAKDRAACALQKKGDLGNGALLFLEAVQPDPSEWIGEISREKSYIVRQPCMRLPSACTRLHRCIKGKTSILTSFLSAPMLVTITKCCAENRDASVSHYFCSSAPMLANKVQSQVPSPPEKFE